MKRRLLFVAGIAAAAIVFYFITSWEPVERVPPVPQSKAPAATPSAPVPPAPPAPTAAEVITPATPAPAVPAAPPVPAVSVEPQPGSLLIPVAGITAGQLSDTFTESRAAGRAHEAIDIIAPRGTPVLAVDDGKVVKLFNSKPGGLTVYQFDPSEKLAYYYAHLDSYAPGIAEGQQLKRGDPVGFVGSTGNANPAAPHLHFSVFVLEPEKRWWQGTAINPYPLLTGRQP